jgi:hypothetical protein
MMVLVCWCYYCYLNVLLPNPNSELPQRARFFWYHTLHSRSAHTQQGPGTLLFYFQEISEEGSSPFATRIISTKYKMLVSVILGFIGYIREKFKVQIDMPLGMNLTHNYKRLTTLLRRLYVENDRKDFHI